MLGKILKDLRTSKGVTQKELAQYLGLTPKMISFYEQNQRTPPADMLVKLSKYFDVTTDYLLGQQSAPQQSHDINNNTGTVNTGTINGNVHNNGIITTVSPVPIPDICKMCQSLSPKARAQIDSLVNMLHEMEHGK